DLRLVVVVWRPGGLRYRASFRPGAIPTNQELASPFLDARSLEHNLGDLQNVSRSTGQIFGRALAAHRDLHGLLFCGPALEQPGYQTHPWRVDPKRRDRSALLHPGHPRLLWRGL